MDNESIPTGEVASVLGTPFDFTAPQIIGSRLAQVPNMHNYFASVGLPVRPLSY